MRFVGRGLKVNRPKAERSHPGVCPRRLEAAPLDGTLWERLLFEPPPLLHLGDYGVQLFLNSNQPQGDTEQRREKRARAENPAKNHTHIAQQSQDGIDQHRKTECSAQNSSIDPTPL